MKKFRIVLSGHVPVRGYAFVDARTHEDAEEIAKELDDREIEGLPIGAPKFDEVLEVQEVWDE